MDRRWPLVGLLLVVTLAASGCGSSPPPRRRTGEEIRLDLANLDRLYLTDKTQKRVIAPASRGGAFRDEATGEICWPAVACQNPACPGRAADGTPVIFTPFDSGFVVKPDGSIGYDITKARKEGVGSGFCPKCYAAFNVKSLPPAQRQKYVDFVKPYELPEVQQKKAALQKELEEWGEYVRTRGQQKMPEPPKG